VRREGSIPEGWPPPSNFMYEHKLIGLDVHYKPETLQEAVLDDMSADGWELISVAGQYNDIFVFRREKK
jgi:hypothetical protein